MPTSTDVTTPRHIAVIGGGISGLSAAYFLSADHRVTLFEAEPRLGGHSRTVLAGRNGDQPVDTGFIVFNRPTYPNLCDLFEALEVPVANSVMSFGASIRGGRFEYGLNNPGALLAQKRRAGDPRYWKMLRDILRFNARAEGALDDPAMTIRDLLDRLGLGRWFRDYYLLPLSGAIWSTPPEGILDFPAAPMVKFFSNHALLRYWDQHQWLTVRGGSVEYLRRLQARLERAGADLRIGAPVTSVTRSSGRVEIAAKGGQPETFDAVVLTAHADQSLAMLGDATPEERAALGAVRFQPNHAVLHCDPSLMPRRRAAWSSWNYVEPASGPGDRIDLTYWMNSLQAIPEDDALFLTLNTCQPIRDEAIYDEVTFQHPVYDRAMVAAQAKIRSMNGAQNTWFCGAWMRNGFHEDGIASAADAADAIALSGMPLAAQ